MQTKSWEAKIPKQLPVNQRTRTYKIFEIKMLHGGLIYRSFVDYKDLTNKQVTLHILQGYIVEQSFDY